MPVPETHAHVFTPRWNQYNTPAKIVTLGHYYPQGGASAARRLLQEADSQKRVPNDDVNLRAMRDHIAWTRTINALNKERQWPLQRLHAMLDPMLEPGIAVIVVPPHRAYQAFWPLRTLAQRLAVNGRIDCTHCLVRHITIRRIVFGGPSKRDLHYRTLLVEHKEQVQGQRILLLDDIAKSGASLTSCREMLYEAGASLVQAAALGRVIVDA